MMIVCYALLGLILSLAFGGAPLWAAGPKVPKGASYGAFAVLAALAAWPSDVASAIGAAVVALSFALTWSPGHGSYHDPGNGSSDNELFRPVVKVLAFGAPAGSVRYCCAGMAVRYGAMTFLTAVLMVGANVWAHTDFSGWWWYGLTGFSAGGIIYILHLAHWDRWRLLPWIDPVRGNDPFRAAIGAVLTACFAGAAS